MSVTPSPIGGFAAQFFDNNGVILSGGKIYTYAAGTTTPQAAYTSASGTTPHANPIILDSAGRVPGGEIWLTDGLVYKFTIETATAILIGTYDNITGVNSNFVNYTVQEEVITATAGQTVFNLATINYTPGTNSLTVYIDGVNQYVGDSYLETDSNTVTFTSGVHVGGEVKFTTAIQTTTGAVDASIVTYDPPFTGGVITNVENKLAQTVSVIDFGADPTGVASSVAAFNAALLNGGTVYVPSGIYKLNSRVNISVDKTTLWLAANVTLNLSGVPATQVPFGNQIHVFADNCAVIGSGPSSVLQITGGSQANAVGILHHYGLTVRDLTIDGDKAGGTAFTDDTFMSGVSVVASTAGGATQDAKAVIDSCIIRNFLQYGINIYGEWASGTKIVNCTVYNNGKTADALSVGAGIVITRGVSRITIANNSVTGNKFMGIFCSSAGVDSVDWAVTGNICSQNGNNGIGFAEISSYASVANVGMKNIAIVGNTCSNNSRSGIELSVDTVGFLKQFTISANVCNNNTQYGVVLISTNTTPQVVSDIVLCGNQAKNNTSGNEAASTPVENVQGLTRAFTPVLRGTSTAGTGTYTSQLGSYVRVGPLVSFQLILDWSAHTGTGNMEITGFPFAAKTGEPLSDFWVLTSAITITGQATFGLSSGQTFGAVGAVQNGAYSVLAMDAAGLLRITGSYLVDA